MDIFVTPIAVLVVYVFVLILLLRLLYDLFGDSKDKYNQCDDVRVIDEDLVDSGDPCTDILSCSLAITIHGLERRKRLVLEGEDYIAQIGEKKYMTNMSNKKLAQYLNDTVAETNKKDN